MSLHGYIADPLNHWLTSFHNCSLCNNIGIFHPYFKSTINFFPVGIVPFKDFIILLYRLKKIWELLNQEAILCDWHLFSTVTSECSILGFNGLYWIFELGESRRGGSLWLTSFRWFWLSLTRGDLAGAWSDS